MLNDSPLVMDETRARVRAAVDELGYRLNATARTLSIGRAQAVGVVVPFFTTHSVIERLRGVVSRLGRHERAGYDLLLFDVEAPEQRADAMRDLARRNRVAGLLIVSLPIFDAELDALARDELPAVLLDVAHPRLPRVVIDNVAGGEMAASICSRRGTGASGSWATIPPTRTVSRPREDRRRGFHAELARAGFELDPALERFAPHGRDEARRSGLALLRLPKPPTAIFAASDVQAIGVLRACRGSRRAGAGGRGRDRLRRR